MIAQHIMEAMAKCGIEEQRNPKHVPGYREALHNPEFLRDAASKVHAVMRHFFPGVNMIAVRGTSGASVGYAMSALFGTHVCYVRKAKHTASHGAPTENHPKGRPYVVVDDFLSTGKTAQEIIERAGKDECRGIILYLDTMYCGEGPLRVQDIPYPGSRQWILSNSDTYDSETLTRPRIKLVGIHPISYATANGWDLVDPTDEW